MAATLPVSGCTQVDGGARYIVSGKLADALGNPVAGARLAVSIRRGDLPLDDESSDWPGFSKTEEDGSFSGMCYGANWGYALLLGVIPVGSTGPPTPEAIEEVYVFYRLASGGEWYKERVQTDEADQERAEPGTRWISVGIVQINPE
ncbi:hypothetical protein LCGC14_0239170 [marine sediment metagenome]|uniref:Uncharacterized protein n=1 Tax=marine sediment metagenome TaxID=412755 RepID=A0A0F9U862_9ZZZZ